MDQQFSTEDTMTYKNLFRILEAYPEKLQDHVFIKDDDEYYEIESVCVADGETNDVLDDGHLYLVLKKRG